jgi:hypothetical protein
MGNPICVDTDIIIDHLRGRNPGADLYARIIIEEIPCTTYITRFELLCGARSQKEQRIINECLLGFKILPFDERSSYEAAKIYRDLKRKGRLIDVRDILIAGVAIANQMLIATKNINDFKRIKGLVLWKP